MKRLWAYRFHHQPWRITLRTTRGNLFADDLDYTQLRRMGLPKLKPGEGAWVRIKFTKVR